MKAQNDALANDDSTDDEVDRFLASNMYVCVVAGEHICMHIHACMYTCAHACMHTRTHACMNAKHACREKLRELFSA